MNNNINETEQNFLNDSNKNKKSNKNIILKIIYYSLQSFLFLVYFITCVFCTFIETIFFIGFLGTATKTAYRK